MGLVDQHVKQVKIDAVESMLLAFLNFTGGDSGFLSDFEHSDEYKKAINELGLTEEAFS